MYSYKHGSIAEQSDTSSDDDVELTDICEEEIKQREAEETRMQEELSRLQLENLLKKRLERKNAIGCDLYMRDTE